MEFAMLGISYKTAALSIREHGAFSDTQCLSFYSTLLSKGISQAVILTTCNRSEIYVLYEQDAQLAIVQDTYVAISDADVLPYLIQKKGRDALLYLYEVCSGYHSQVPGEDQITHQMKKAYTFACECGACAKEMHKIFQSCFSSIRRIRTSFQLSQNSISIAYSTMQKLKQSMSLQGRSILIVGSGEMACLLTTYAKQEPFAHIRLCNRTMSHVKNAMDGCEIVAFSDRYLAIATSDIICSATASPHAIIVSSQVWDTKQKRYFIDLALPRDMEEALQYRKGITLWNLDDMQDCVDEHVQERKIALQKAHAQMEQDAYSTWDWLQHHTSDTIIKTLQQRSEDVAMQTYELLNHKLTLSNHEQYVLKKVLHTSFLRMVKEPMLQLQKIEKEDRSAYIKMLERLFNEER